MKRLNTCLLAILLIGAFFLPKTSFSIEKWSQELSANPSLSPAVGDIDGDGWDEIVVGVGNPTSGWGETRGIEVFRHDGEREFGWPKDTDKNMMSSPALGDLDGDGIDDIVICSESGVHIYFSSFPDSVWFRSAGTGGNNLWSLATPIIADLENDGQLEVLIINNSGTVYAWHSNGQPVIAGNNGVFAQAEASDMSGFPCLAVADLDKDGINEVIAATNGLYIFNPQGQPLLRPGDYSYAFNSATGIAIADIDADQNLEVIVFGTDGVHFGLFAFNKDGSQVAGYPIMLEDLRADLWYANHPAIGDLDGDGTLEIVVSVFTIASCGRIYAWHQDGTPLRPNGSEDPVFAYICETSGSPILADVNGDGNVDVIARAGYGWGSGYERILAWDYHGNPLPGFPLEATDVPSQLTLSPYTPVVADMDKDGKLDMILTTDYVDTLSKARLVSWELDTDYDTSKIPWPKYMHDKWNSGRYGFKPAEEEIPNIPPVGFSIKSWDSSSVTLAWNPKAPWLSLGYNIYRSTISGELGEKINSDLIPQPDSQYQDLGLTLGQTYYYTITNIDTVQQESERSKEVKVIIGQPTAPTGLEAQIEQNLMVLVKLTWQTNPVEENITGYKIYCKKPDLTAYQLLGFVMTDTSYVDSSLKIEGTYCYRITAVNSIAESSPSKSIEVKIQPIGYPPYGLEVLSWGNTDVTLNWRVQTQGDGCNIYRSTTSGSYSGTPINSTPIDDPWGLITYQDTTLTEGVTYYYIVTQIQAGVESSPSNQVSFLAGRPQAIDSLKAELKNCHIIVHWKRSAEGDVVKYKIYDMPRAYGQMLTDTILIDSVENDTIYTDPATNDSLAHYYFVTAVDSFDLESFPPAHPNLSAAIEGPLYPLPPPSEFQINSYTDTSITFRIYRGWPFSVQGYNIYRSTVSREYNNPPINPTPITGLYTYYTTGLPDGRYFFNATCIKQNQCGTIEGGMDTLKEISFTVGTPTAPTGLRAVVNDNCNIALSWKPNPEGDVVKYRIYHRIGFPVYGDSFQVKDSVFAPETTYVDTSIEHNIEQEHEYALIAIDSLGLESPMSLAYVWFGLYYYPSTIQIMSYTDTSATIQWSAGGYDWHKRDIVGCNIYRSLTSHVYTGLEPINDTLIIPDSIGFVQYTDFDVVEGTTYYYTVTNVNKCGFESERCPNFAPPGYPPMWLETSVLVGKPHSPLLKIKSGKQNIKLRMYPTDTDIKGYKVFRQEGSGAFQVINPLCLDTVYTDSLTSAGVGYHYKAIAIDTSNLESSPSDSVEGCIMTFNQGIGLVDMTLGNRFDLVNSDSVNAFYQRALQGYDYTYIDHSDIESSPLTLFELSAHPVAIVHSEDQRADQSMDYWTAYRVLEQYLDAGGALFIEGRRNLSSGYSYYDYQFRGFAPGGFGHDYLNLDSAYVPEDWNFFSKPIEEFVGANRASQMDGYPQIVELDTFRVNHASGYTRYDTTFNGKLPGVGYFMPLDSSEVIYTFISAYDSSASNGKPVALKHITDSSAIIYFDFPLWFVKEDIATEILHKAIADLETFASDTIVAPENLTCASVYPNPFKPYQGHTSMTFDNLTAQAKIEVFTIIGERVCTLEQTNGNGRLSWNVTNSDGKKLASGVYIYRVTNNKGQQKISKFAVIR